MTRTFFWLVLCQINVQSGALMQNKDLAEDKKSLHSGLALSLRICLTTVTISHCSLYNTWIKATKHNLNRSAVVTSASCWCTTNILLD